MVRGQWGNLAKFGIFNDHRESGPRFNVSSEGRCFLTVKCPRHYTGALGPTQTAMTKPLILAERIKRLD